MDKKYSPLITIGLVIILCLAFYYGYINNYFLKYPCYRYKYTVEINTDSPENYTIYVPILVNEDDGEISKAMNNLEKSGKCSYEITNSRNGWAMMIEGIGNITLLSEGEKEIQYAWLSMYNASYGENKSFGEYWIYSDHKGNNSIDVWVYGYIDKGHSEFEGKSYVSYVRCQIKESGWQRYRGDHGVSVV